MGQAKARGTREERIARAQERQEKQEPINVPCKTCNDVLNGFTLIAQHPEGALWKKVCSCGATTHALVQSENATTDLNRTFRASLKHLEQLGGKDRKMSVTFIEKSIDSVETGIIRLPKLNE